MIFTGLYLGGLRGESFPPPPPPQTAQLPSKKSCDHSGHSLLCLKIINILMHQIASQHIPISKKLGPP